MKTKIVLQKAFFSEKEKILIQSDGFSVSAFLYSTGVAALRVQNKKGEIIWLPFKGQQIWRASFCGRDLTMKSIFPEPVDTQDFNSSYGCFMLHCGMTAMGNPAPEDTHPQHGELPSIAYDSAYVEVGEDKNGGYVALGGEVRYRQCFATDYSARPCIKLYEDDTVMHISLTVENHRTDPLEYLYLCHLNFRPQEGAKLVYSAYRDAKHIRVFKDIPENLPAVEAEKMATYMENLEKNPALMDDINDQTQIYKPEIVFRVFYESDSEGWARCMQTTPEGGADYVAFKTEELPYGIRWISRTGDEDAMGMCLPATAEHKGLNYCRKNNQMKILPANAQITFQVKAGWLPPEKAADEMKKCQGFA